MKVAVTCEICRRTVLVNPSKAVAKRGGRVSKFRTCSIKCRRAIGKKCTLTCAHCNKTKRCNPSKARHRYCSVKCARDARDTRRARPCPVCEKLVVRRDRHVGDYCSRRCFGIARRHNLTGQIFGLWEVLGPSDCAKPKWRCKCRGCGIERLKDASALVGGQESCLRCSASRSRDSARRNRLKEKADVAARLGLPDGTSLSAAHTWLTLARAKVPLTVEQVAGLSGTPCGRTAQGRLSELMELGLVVRIIDEQARYRFLYQLSFQSRSILEEMTNARTKN